jgi:hypothetical protein
MRVSATLGVGALVELRLRQFRLGGGEIVGELFPTHFEHAAHLDHALHLVAQFAAALIQVAGRALDFTTHRGELALHGLDPGLRTAQFALQIAHHLLMEFLGHFQSGHHRTQAMLAVSRLDVRAFGGAALILVLLLDHIAFGGDHGGLSDHGAGLDQLLAQRRDVLRNPDQRAQPLDHADQHILGEIGQGAGIGAAELAAQVGDLAQERGIGAAHDIGLRSDAVDLRRQGAQLGHRLLVDLMLDRARLLGRGEQPVRLGEVLLMPALELGIGLLQRIDVLLGAVHLMTCGQQDLACRHAVMLILVVDIQQHGQSTVGRDRRLVALGAIDQALEHRFRAGDAMRGLGCQVDLLHLADQLPELGDLMAVGQIVGDFIDLIDQGVEVAGAALALGERVVDRLMRLAQLVGEGVLVAGGALGQADECLIETAQVGDDQREFLRRLRGRQVGGVDEERGVHRSAACRRCRLWLVRLSDEGFHGQMPLIGRIIGEGVVLDLTGRQQLPDIGDLVGSGPV